MSLIEKLTPKQEALIPVYREKWRAIERSTKPIDHQKAREVVKAAYAEIGLSRPEILIFDSPYEALKTFIVSQAGRGVRSQLVSQLVSQLERQLRNQLPRQLYSYLYSELRIQPWHVSLVYQLKRQQGRQLEKQRQLSSLIDNCIFPVGAWNCEVNPCLYDFCISGLNFTYERRRWKTLELLVKNCGWILPFEKICFVCDRATKLSFDSEENFHAEGEPAIQFADGYSLYFYHGIELPEKYKKLPPVEWQSQWLLEEKNAEIRRVLIQGIGYTRICQELQAIELDSWQEYTLVGIDNDVDDETIYLLKMTCPSTGFIHALRVPPDMKSAREAIRWVNWEVDPEEFQQQT